jgi:uncharacterized protein DUF4328
MKCPRCSYPAAGEQATCRNCGTSLAVIPPAGYPPLPVRVVGSTPMPGANLAPTSVDGLSRATMILLLLAAVAFILEAGIRIGDTGAGVAGGAGLLEVALAPLFIVWFFHVRRNAGFWGPQRRSQGWSVGAWFTPILFLWFPFQIADDVWQASLPPTAPKRLSQLVNGWWACWVLAWLTEFPSIRTTTIAADGSSFVHYSVPLTLGSTLLSDCFAAAAAILGALMVRSIGRMQQARMDG